MGCGWDAHLAECCHITEGSVLDDLVALAGVPQLRVALHRLWGQADACALAAGGVRRVEVVVALEDHQLALGLGDVCGEGFQDVAEGHLQLGLQLGACCQTRGQLDFEELPAARKEMRDDSLRSFWKTLVYETGFTNWFKKWFTNYGSDKNTEARVIFVGKYLYSSTKSANWFTPFHHYGRC